MWKEAQTKFCKQIENTLTNSKSERIIVHCIKTIIVALEKHCAPHGTIENECRNPQRGGDYSFFPKKRHNCTLIKNRVHKFIFICGAFYFHGRLLFDVSCKMDLGEFFSLSSSSSISVNHIPHDIICKQLWSSAVQNKNKSFSDNQNAGSHLCLE